MSFLTKKLEWLGSSKDRTRRFPEITKDQAGSELFRVQIGQMPTDWRPMPDIGSGVFEIRLHNPDEYRIFCIANYPESIYVLHVFQKTTQRTSEIDKQAGRAQYAKLQKARSKRPPTW
jgi:phage-related protein